MNKKNRLELIKEIIRNNKIASQHELQSQLEKENVEVTQATLSRDLNTLKVVKIVDEEAGHIYALPGVIETEDDPKVDYFPIENFKYIKFSQNLAVIKSTPSFASSMALIIDQLELDEMIGSIAGDDTVMIIMSEGTTPDDLTKALRRRIPALSEKL
ncbi:MAG: ArgR family transcriptional regulator [Candidatus Marinimicrobia bacterium]|nr:ArgR family transcriptional regulator [Candidatus Neomarinimicrobiota bacterium]